MRTTGTRVLPQAAREAQRRILDMVDADQRVASPAAGQARIVPRSASL
jgi:hypothetical protein